MIDVLVVGAGPTGLALAAHLRAHGASVRIVEQRQRPRPSRAFVVHPRTLETLSQVGLAEPLVARGETAATVVLHSPSRSATLPLSGFRLDDTAFPFLLAIPQAMVETTMEQALASRGLAVERGVRCVTFDAGAGYVTALLRRDDGRMETADAKYIVGCDGVDSTVRREAGISFPGSSYRAALWLADLDIDGDVPQDAIHGFVSKQGVLFLFPAGTPATWRLLTVRPSGPGASPSASAAPPPGREELQAVVDATAGGALRLREPVWSVEQRLPRGQADRYRDGRVILAGDAAHVHSPAGAQGMNTGIQDAANLGWKLALVARGLAAPELLDSYAAERWPVARWVRRLTDLAFVGEAADVAPLPWLRGSLGPLVVPLLDGRRIPAALLRVVAGLTVRYRHSPAVSDARRAARLGVRAGDRLPDAVIVADGRAQRLQQALLPPGLHLLCCGDGAWDEAGLGRLRQRYDGVVGVHRLRARPVPGGLHDPGGHLLRRLRVATSAVLLARPDGYVAFRSEGTAVDGVERYLARWLPGC